MIGVIGVAPAGAPVSTAVPGAHGGNMDTRLIGAGTVVYLPIAHEGALFAAGDLHAAMGDGEICGTGVEVSGVDHAAPRRQKRPADRRARARDD